MIIYSKNIYKTVNDIYILILYNISSNHYVGIEISNDYISNSIKINSVNKYVIPNSLKDYRKSEIKSCLYFHGNPLAISENDYKMVLNYCKDMIILYLSSNISYNVDDISYLKWCMDKYLLNRKEKNEIKYHQNGIYWVNLGYNVGSELRKIRPAILWRSTSDKKIWTIIPLTTKDLNDKYYFHYDLNNKCLYSAKIESISNISYKRIIEPYFLKDKVCFIDKIDVETIKKIIKKYYTFE